MTWFHIKKEVFLCMIICCAGSTVRAYTPAICGDALHQPPVGDLSGDCRVTLEDLVLFAQEWLEVDCAAIQHCYGADLNFNGSVNYPDYVMLENHWQDCSAPECFVPGQTMVVFGYNDLGMHCMQADFSEMMILPPYNTLHAQIVRRSGEEPDIIGGGLTVNYVIPSNTYSAGKTNFWDYVQALLGVVIPPNIGLTGNGLAGAMLPSGTNDWIVTGIPITPINDQMQTDPYPLATITVISNNQEVARTQAIVPVSTEMTCQLCHNTPGISIATDILQAHDRLHGTTLEAQKPVLCGNCHAQEPLQKPGEPGVPSLSRAMHSAHADRFSPAVLAQLNDVSCYACHPGIETQCLRDVHAANGMNCMSCHSSMTAVASKNRPWLDEPRCDDCHSRAEFEFEQPGTLFRDSIGHGGIHCEACHNTPHAVTPTITALDNAQAINLQGYSGPINNCVLCHSQPPNEEFPHRFEP